MKLKPLIFSAFFSLLLFMGNQARGSTCPENNLKIPYEDFTCKRFYKKYNILTKKRYDEVKSYYQRNIQCLKKSILDIHVRAFFTKKEIKKMTNDPSLITDNDYAEALFKRYYDVNSWKRYVDEANTNFKSKYIRFYDSSETKDPVFFDKKSTLKNALKRHYAQYSMWFAGFFRQNVLEQSIYYPDNSSPAPKDTNLKLLKQLYFVMDHHAYTNQSYQYKEGNPPTRGLDNQTGLHNKMGKLRILKDQKNDLFYVQALISVAPEVPFFIPMNAIAPTFQHAFLTIFRGMFQLDSKNEKIRPTCK